MERRKFLELAGVGLSSALVWPRLAAATGISSSAVNADRARPTGIPFGSGHFGDWFDDEFGLPAYRYTCDQITDPKAITPVHPEWRAPTDHTHQVGNNRLVAAVSNYGYVQVRQDEGSPKFLNDYSPEDLHYGAGVGFLADGDNILSTYYSGNNDSFERIMGVGYLRKRVTGPRHSVDQVIFAPFGDDPVLISQVTITNHSGSSSRPRWVEYWGCQQYQFSYRSFMQASVQGTMARPRNCDANSRTGLRIAFACWMAMPGCWSPSSFLAAQPEDEKAWQEVPRLATQWEGWLTEPIKEPTPEVTMEDLAPPPTFLVSLDAPADGWATNAKELLRSWRRKSACSSRSRPGPRYHCRRTRERRAAGAPPAARSRREPHALFRLWVCARGIRTGPVAGEVSQQRGNTGRTQASAGKPMGCGFTWIPSPGWNAK